MTIKDILDLPSGNHAFEGVQPEQYKALRKDLGAFNRGYLKKYPWELVPILFTYKDGTLDISIRPRRNFDYKPVPALDFSAIEAETFVETDESGVNRIRQIAHKLGGLSVRQVENGCIIAPKAETETVAKWINQAAAAYKQPVPVPFPDGVCKRTVRPGLTRWNRQHGQDFRVRKIDQKYFLISPEDLGQKISENE